MYSLSISVCTMELPLVHSSRSRAVKKRSRAPQSSAFGRGDLEGIGEATPIERYGESVESVIAYFAAHPLACDDPFRLESLLHAGIPAGARGARPRAPRSDWQRTRQTALRAARSRSVARAADFVHDRHRRPADDAAQGRRGRALSNSESQARSRHALEQVEIVAAIRGRYGGAIRLDANEGWNVDEAITILRELQRYEIEFCEQPVRRRQPTVAASDPRPRLDTDRRR